MSFVFTDSLRIIKHGTKKWQTCSEQFCCGNELQFDYYCLPIPRLLASNQLHQGIPLAFVKFPAPMPVAAHAGGIADAATLYATAQFVSCNSLRSLAHSLGYDNLQHIQYDEDDLEMKAKNYDLLLQVMSSKKKFVSFRRLSVKLSYTYIEII